MKFYFFFFLNNLQYLHVKQKERLRINPVLFYASM